MGEQEQHDGTLVYMVLASDSDEFQGEIEAKLKDGWLMNGPWRLDDEGFFAQMMVKPVQPSPSQIDVLELRIAQLENVLSQLIAQLQGGSGIARPGLILPSDLKGGRSH